MEKSITVEQFVARRLGQAKEKAETPDSSSAGESQAAADAPDSKTEAQQGTVKDAEQKQEAVPSQDVDLEKLSEADLAELAKKLGSRAVARFGELTAKRRQAEEQLAALQAQLAQQQAQFAPPAVKPSENPYSDLKTPQDVQAKHKELTEVQEWAEEVLFSNEHAAPDDVVTTVNGNNITKAQVRKALKDAQKAIKEHLPAQLSEISASFQRKQVRAQLEQNARKELNWLEGDNETRKNFEAMRNGPVVQEILAKVPAAEPYIEYIAAHAANSIWGRKEIKIDSTASKPSPTPPKNPASSSAPSERSESRESKAASEAKTRLATTGKVDDFVALRTAQFSQRKSIR